MVLIHSFEKVGNNNANVVVFKPTPIDNLKLDSITFLNTMFNINTQNNQGLINEGLGSEDGFVLDPGFYNGTEIALELQEIFQEYQGNNELTQDATVIWDYIKFEFVITLGTITNFQPTTCGFLLGFDQLTTQGPAAQIVSQYPPDLHREKVIVAEISNDPAGTNTTSVNIVVDSEFGTLQSNTFTDVTWFSTDVDRFEIKFLDSQGIQLEHFGDWTISISEAN